MADECISSPIVVAASSLLSRSILRLSPRLPQSSLLACLLRRQRLMGQDVSHADPPVDLLDSDVVVQPQREHDPLHQPQSEITDNQRDGEQAEANNNSEQPHSSSSTSGWLTLTRWLPSLMPFSSGNKKRRRDEHDEHSDSTNQPQLLSQPSASTDSASHQYKHIRLSVNSSSASASVASSSHSSPDHSCGECDSLRAQVAELQQQLSHTRSLSSDLTCAVCHFLFLSPVTAECGHSWCLHCLVKSLQTKRQCPLCRSSITQRPIPTALLLTSQLQTAVSQLTDADNEERLKEQTRRLHEHIDYDTELARLIPPASSRRTARHPFYDNSDGVFRCPWCMLEVQFADSCCSYECGSIDWSEQMDQHQWRQADEDDDVEEEVDDFEEMDEFEDVRVSNAADPSAAEDDDDETTRRVHVADDGDYSCTLCGALLEYSQTYCESDLCCHGRVDWTEVYRAQAESDEYEEYEEVQDVEEEAEVDVDDLDEGEEEEEDAEAEEVDDDGFDDDAGDDAGEAEWLDGDEDGALVETMQLRREIFHDAGVDEDDDEVIELLQRRRSGGTVTRLSRRTSNRGVRTRAVSASEYAAIRNRLLNASERADEAEAETAEVDADIEEALAEVEAVDEQADIDELQAAVAGTIDDVDDDGEAELELVTNAQLQEAVESLSEHVLVEAELDGLYWSGDEADESAVVVDANDGEVEWTGSQQSTVASVV